MNPLKRQAIYLSNCAGYSAFDEEMLRDKARLICDQFLSSPILPKCRVNVTPEMASNVIEKVKLGMIDQTLFYECATRVFPLLVHHWSQFCHHRHQYVPRKKLISLRRQLVLQKRRDILAQRTKQLKRDEMAKQMLNMKMEEAPLIDYNQSTRYEDCWRNASKTLGCFSIHPQIIDYRILDDTPIVSFSLSTGMRVTLPIKPNPSTQVRSSFTTTTRTPLEI